MLVLNLIEMDVTMLPTFSRRFVALALVAAPFVSLPAAAKSPGTLTDAKALAQQAIGHVNKVGFDQAVKDVNADQATWGIASRDKIAYVTVYDLTGTCLAHSVNSSLAGRNLIDFKDQNGKEVFKEAVALAKNGSGTVKWMWANPVTKKVSPAEGYIQRIPGKDAFIWAVAFVD